MLKWSLANAPAGVTISETTGIVTVQLNTAVSVAVTITATGPAGPASMSVPMNIVSYSAPALQNNASYGVVTLSNTSTAYTIQQTAANTGAITWSIVSGGPSGVQMDASSTATQGVLRLPAIAGYYSIMVRAANPAGTSATGTISITVQSPPTPTFWFNLSNTNNVAISGSALTGTIGNTPNGNEDSWQAGYLNFVQTNGTLVHIEVGTPRIKRNPQKRGISTPRGMSHNMKRYFSSSV